MLEKTLESPLGSKEVKPVHPKGNQPWIFIGRTDAEAEAPILWPPDAKSWLTEKDLDAGKDWRQRTDRGWDGLIASWTQWTWANSGSYRRTEEPGMLRSLGLHRVGHSDWTTTRTFSLAFVFCCFCHQLRMLPVAQNVQNNLFSGLCLRV